MKKNLPNIAQVGAIIAVVRTVALAEDNMFRVIVFICHIFTPGAECNRATAIDVYNAPDANSQVQCVQHGQATIAQNAPSKTIENIAKGEEYIKIWCKHITNGGTIG